MVTPKPTPKLPVATKAPEYLPPVVKKPAPAPKPAVVKASVAIK